MEVLVALMPATSLEFELSALLKLLTPALGLAGSDAGSQLLVREGWYGVLRSEKKDDVEAFRNGR